MTEITRVSATIATAAASPGAHTGTNDHVYLGISGTGGGREFSLDVDGFDDWEPGSKVAYGFGPGPPFSPPSAYRPKKESTNAADQLSNIDTDITNVTHVYLRKQGDRTPKGDDYWELEECQVFFTSGPAPDGESRVYSLTGPVRLGNEYGHKVWLDKGFKTQMLEEERFETEPSQEQQ